MDNFRDWYLRNQVRITWFIIGWMTISGFHNLGQEKYLWAVIDFALAYLNYHMDRHNV